jgi:flagellar motor switch protein FliN/FliY
MTDVYGTDPREEAEDRHDFETAPPRSSPAGNGDFSVALTLELETMQIPLKRLQALREGAVLPLDIAEGPIPVRVLAGKRTVAHGTLVNVGPGYGVLIGPDREEA